MNLLSCIGCWGQTKKKLCDLSPSESPVRVSGVVSFVDDSSSSIRSYQVGGHFHNVSNKDVALIVVYFATDKGAGRYLSLTYGEDYFFSNLLEAGETDDFDTVSDVKFVASDPVQDHQVDDGSALHRYAEIVFVQFADGTEWGDSESARGTFAQRKQIAHELDRLERVLLDDGQQALANELSSNGAQLPPCIRSLHDRCAASSSPSCLADGLRSVLETARQREINMKFSPVMSDQAD